MTETYTLWTYPPEHRHALSDVEVTEELRARMERVAAMLEEPDRAIADRLQPYTTPVTQETMRQTVK